MINDKYDHNKVEKEILNNLNLEEIYKSNPNSDKPAFSTMMPPPNITGNLHIGHALVLTLQDILVRFHRMLDYDVLWQAGLDHAGIATQIMVEKDLLSKNITKETLGRKNFVKEVFKWKEKTENNIINQIKRIGASCDYSNVEFTMSNNFVSAVNKTFVSLYEEGLIYKDKRLVNWDTKLLTAVSDLEVINKEEKGKFFYINYPLVGGGTILVATTRPETIFGDTAIVINPKDKRYINFINRKAIVPIINREIPIILDEYSDIEKGSGAVKITPAHDFNDFEIGKRHNLEFINILNKDGTLNNNTPQDYQVLSIKNARDKIVNHLSELNLIERIEDHIMTIPYGDRSNTVIEPLLSEQWFVNTTDMAKKALEVVKNKELKLIPNNWENLYFDWLNKIKPWCISRQLWWGHQIPVWYSYDGTIFVAENEILALEKAKNHYGKEIELNRDNDVLDTWFSSSLWSFATLGWPNMNNKKLKKYYPNSTLVTGFDILFFWVTRMIMMGMHFIKEIPFKEVYLHALVLDERGQKMSKTKGNVVNPLDLMDKYGTDALRFTLALYSGHGRNIKFSEKTLEGSRNFVTKIWNAYRFLYANDCKFNKNFKVESIENDINKWILYKFDQLYQKVTYAIKEYKFDDIANLLYKFIWNIYCDWYIELIKPILYDNNLQLKQETQETSIFCFVKVLELLHPLMPFFSENLFAIIMGNQEYVLFKQKLIPILDSSNQFLNSSENIDFIITFINKIRSIRSFLRISASSFIDVYLNQDNKIINCYKEIICKLARLKNIYILDSISDNKTLFKDIINNNLILGINLEGIIDIKIELNRLNTDKLKIQNNLKIIDKRLNNKDFIFKANPEAIKQSKDQKKELTNKLHIIDDFINKLTI